MVEFNPGGAASLNSAVKMRLVANTDTNVLTDAQLALLLAAAPKASPTFTGTPAAPTATAGTNTTQLANTAFVQSAVAALINAAPGALDTLDELAAAMGDDANFAATVTSALALKQNLHANLTQLSNLTFTADRVLQLGGTGNLSLIVITNAGRNMLATDLAGQLTVLGFSTFFRTLIDDTSAAAVMTTLGISSFAQTLLDDTTAAAAQTTLGISAFAQSLLDDTSGGAAQTTLGISNYAKTLLDDADAGTAQTTLGISTFIKGLLDDADVSAAQTTLGISTFVKTLLDDGDASVVLTTLGVSPFIQTLLNDADAGTAQSTLGISTFVKTLLDDADVSAAQSTLGISTFIKGLLDDADAGTAQTTLGISTFAKTLLDDADAAATLTTLGIPQASVALTDGATITPSFTAGRNFHVTLAGNRTLANPTNQAAGQAGRILIKQDASGTRTLAYGSHWLFPGGDPVLSTTADAVDMLCYDVQASGEIYATLLKAFS